VKEKWAELKKLNIINKNSRTIPENLKNLDDLNRHFTQLSLNNISPDRELLDFYASNPRIHDAPFAFEQVNEEQVSQIILNTKSKAFGNDNLNITLIVLCCPFIIPHLTYLINCCILQSYFPKNWKFANVIPLPKKNNPTEFGHLRSISLLPVLSKVLEKVMEQQISLYVQNKNILPIKQSGFRKGHSCTSALADVTDDIVSGQDRGEATVLVLLDYTKAFDMLQHDILIAILHYVGFHQAASNFISSFLSNRKQRVVIDGNFSNYLNVAIGVPQGSVLGPLLYSIFTSTFPEVLHYCKYHLYADDTQLYFRFKPNDVLTANYQLNSDLKEISTISKRHLLKINPSKTVAMLFCHDSHRNDILNNLKLKLEDDDILFHNSARNLGLVLDTKLKFTEHVTNCLRKGFSMLKLLYSHRYYLSKDVRKNLCDSLILSHFNFADIVYGPFLDCYNKKRVQKLQNCCIRFICGIRRGQRVSHKLQDLCWLNMFNRRSLHGVCFYYKVIKFKCPPYLYNKIEFRSDVHNVNVRRRDFLTIPSHKKELFKKSFSYNIACAINKYKITDFSLSVLSFKQKLKHLFFK
jgi:hypothetical protein